MSSSWSHADSNRQGPKENLNELVGRRCDVEDDAVVTIALDCGHRFAIQNNVCGRADCDPANRNEVRKELAGNKR